MATRTREIDRLSNNLKSSLPTIGRGHPINSQGNDGDFTFRRTSSGLKLYIKASGKWHGVKVGESFNNLEKSIEEIKSTLRTMDKFRLPSTYDVIGDFTLDASGDIELNADGSTITFKDASQTILTIEGGAAPSLTMESLTYGDSFSITLAASGEATLATVDQSSHAADLTLDIDGSINLDSEDGNVVFKNSGTDMTLIGQDRIRMYHSTDQADFFNIAVGASGLTTLTTVDAGAAVGHLVLAPDGDVQITPENNLTLVGPLGGAFKTDNVILMKERIAAITDVAAYGQLWVKTASPNLLYFTNDAGTDIQLTTADAVNASGGGTNNHILTFTARANTRYDNWYFPSISYGPYYYAWTSSQNSSSLPTTWYDSYNPNLVVPVAMTLKSYHFYFNCSAHTENLEFATLKGTGVTYGSAGNYTLSNVGATQAVTIGTSDILYKAEQTGLSVSFAAGDIVMPTLRRTTTDTSAFKYVEISWSAVFEVD